PDQKSDRVRRCSDNAPIEAEEGCVPTGTSDYLAM
ncbi:hypothetical protein A2U01_0050132, partial [Trifolium medium]|nr:hypothetical protein [Trifolium medium]